MVNLRLVCYVHPRACVFTEGARVRVRRPVFTKGAALRKKDTALYVRVRLVIVHSVCVCLLVSSLYPFCSSTPPLIDSVCCCNLSAIAGSTAAAPLTLQLLPHELLPVADALDLRHPTVMKVMSEYIERGGVGGSGYHSKSRVLTQSFLCQSRPFVDSFPLLRG